MKVLLVSPCDGHTHTYIKSAFEQLKHSVTEMDYRAVFSRLGADNLNSKLKFLAKDSDLTLILKGELISPEVIKSIHPCALWNFDSWYANSPDLLALAANSDVFFTPSGGFVKFYRDQGINAFYLPEAADPEKHSFVNCTIRENERYGSDLCFIGTVADVAERAEWLKTIGDIMGDTHSLKIWGSFPDPLVEKWHMGTRAKGDFEHNKIVSCSKIILDKTRTPNIRGAISARVYRTLAAKGFLLMRNIEGLDDQFTPGVHLETYKSTKDCLDQIERYINTPYTRQQIAKDGYDYVMAKHTWRNRIEELLTYV